MKTTTPTVKCYGIEVPAYMSNLQRTYFLYYYKQFIKDGWSEESARSLAEWDSGYKMKSIKKTKASVLKSGFTY